MSKLIIIFAAYLVVREIFRAFGQIDASSARARVRSEKQAFDKKFDKKIVETQGRVVGEREL